ncbi:hypothetical protein [Cohaesibacter sp. ES.047]|uniref:hypothetical protein n=1 Tax=Cohaesibacter sp. ES.047 TaxID=1798205 RepID=UPI000BB6A980|nr:hypothetical protein [Cohaesibacter sp. ES.047]
MSGRFAAPCRLRHAGTCLALFAFALQFYLSTLALAAHFTVFSATDERAAVRVICSGSTLYGHDLTRKSVANSQHSDACIFYRNNVVDEAAAIASGSRDFQLTAFYVKLLRVAAVSDRVWGNWTGAGSSRSPPFA